jgi:O-antigen/teichoic acid export membrane protein
MTAASPPIESTQAVPHQRPWLRAAVSLGANLTRGAISFLTAMVIARTLGAKGYGDYTFLLSTFAALTLLLDCGTTSAFYTMLAARPRGHRFFAAYGIWTVGVQFFATFLIIAFVLSPGAVRAIWLGFDRTLVLLSLTSSFITTQIWSALTQMAEAARKTVFIQVVSTAQVILHLVVVFAAIQLGALSLTLLLVLPIVEFLLLTVALLPTLMRLNVEKENAESWRSVILEYWQYCAPLVMYSVIGFAFQFADRWFLQHFAGAMQQGYFSIGLQYASIANLVTVSVLAVVWKEIADASAKKDVARVRTMFLRARSVVFFFGAAVSAMVVPYVPVILQTTAGRQFAGATICVSLMFVYPIHQAVSQLQQTFLLATGATWAYSIIGIVTMLISIPAAYMVVASPTAYLPGLGLGAVGLAIKFVVLQLIGVTLQFWCIRRSHAFPWPIAYDIAVLAILFSASFGLKALIDLINRSGGIARSMLPSAVFGVAVYAIGLGLVVIRWPTVAGFTQTQRDEVLRMIRKSKFNAR